ncbi:MAG: enoyl-CoA hydratase/isomerase family protein [Syntrophaceae bacterium]|nr:enoyl-CoA hydratase/isomerase family protein [Syntrophaceae bacterium]
MEFETIRAEIRPDRAGVLTLNRPELRNAISVRMRKEISACLEAWKEDPAVGVLVMTGAGAAFSAGFDLKEFRDPTLTEEIFTTSSRYHRDVWKFPKPVIGAVNGPALAGGFDLAKLCDIRICARSAVFGHPEIKFGSPVLYTPLRWIVGEGIARDLCLSGRTMGAEEALRTGLVSEVAEDGQVLERALAIAATLLEAPLSALTTTKSFMIDGGTPGMEASFLLEHDEGFRRVLPVLAAAAKKK